MSGADSVTVLTTKGPLATKRITRLPGAARPVIEAYGKAAHFSISEAPVSGIDTIAAALNSVELRRTSFLVRGKPTEGIDRWSARRRLHARKAKDGTVEPATLEPVVRHWIPLDLDSIACPDSLDPVHEPDRAVEHVVALLPEEFHGATCWWAFTSGQGVKDGIRIRLFYWADRPLADWELKQWLGDSPVDPSIFAPAQPIYVAKPLFVGMPDPVPIRSGIWRGDRDEITPPAIKKPKVRDAASGQPFFAEPGGSYEYHRSHIGDHDSGSGFFAPIKSAVASWIARQGSAADTEWLRADLERAIHEAPRDPAKHPDDYVDLRVRDLEPLIAAILALEVAAEAERRQASECEPSYPAPLGSVAEARERLAQMFDEHVRRPSPTQPRVPDIARSWSGGTSKRAWPHEAGAVLDFDAHGPPAPPACPVQAISVDVGLGKTRTWRERVAPALVGGAFPCILAVPRHRLGDEIVHDLAETGITARVFRGREAADPEQPGENMCRELARVTLIADALGVVSRQACKHKGSVCESYDVCGYQRQRQGEPDVWIVPHQLLFRVRPSFIPEPASLVIDESFWSGALHGIDVPVKLWVADLREVREIEGPGGEYYTSSTSDLMAISHRVCSAIEGEEDGRIRQGALTRASLTAADCRDALRLEWQRKLDIEVEPTTPLAVVKALCRRITAHNQLVARLARFWGLLARTIETPCKRSPWIAFQKAEPLPGAKGNAPAIRMIWRDDIHESWGAATLVMDATLPAPIVHQFFPKMPKPLAVAAPMPHTRVRQITDRAMTAEMLIPTDGASERTNVTRRANVERVRRFVEVRAEDLRPGKVLVVCQLGLETALVAGALPGNVEIEHFNNITGENVWSDVALVIVVGRTEPSPRTVEQITRALFGAEVMEIAPDESGAVRYPAATRGIRMRDGRGIAVQGPMHPDERAEAVRWAICEAGLVQAIGRGRGVNRSAADPLQIDIVTNVVLPIEVDEVTTWNRIQPSLAQIMRTGGAVPLSYTDMAAAYPDLFVSRDAAKMALTRENPEQMPIEKYLIGVCSGFRAIGYRRRGQRGPAGELLYDPTRIDPLAWLTDRIGDVLVL